MHQTSWGPARTTARSRAGGASMVALGTLLMALVLGTTPPRAEGQAAGDYFRRIATFPVFFNFCDGAVDFNACADTETVAEIVAASDDGNTLIYTDSETENLGFVDITDPASPQPGGVLGVDGEPTSIAVVGMYALAAVNTSPDFSDPSGYLAVVHVPSQTVVREIDLGGQPDAVAISPDRRYAAIAIENERDEDAGDGRPPQSPPGNVVIVDLVSGNPAAWSTRTVELVGVPDKFPEDPEPELITINARNEAVVTLQENNHIVLIRLRDGKITGDFAAGTVDLEQIDTVENSLIELSDSIEAVEREPDSVVWVTPNRFATADEGDLDGGSRGITIFQSNGKTRFESGNSLEHLVARIGHYPEERSENKGNEPEGIAFGRYGTRDFLFAGSERSSIVVVYRMVGNRPRFHQVLPSQVGPEGLLPIPSRNLFVVASEDDDRGDAIRSSLIIYRLDADAPTYPTVTSASRDDGTPIPWGALSALASHPADTDTAYSVYDSFYRASRIFTLDVSGFPARITGETVLRDALGNTVDLDPEGLAVRSDGSFWVASEGGCDPNDCSGAKTPNEILAVAPTGDILDRVVLPPAVDALQVRFGFEGVAATGAVGGDELVYVAFQREWAGDPANHVRIGRYEPASGAWTFFYYPIDPPASPNGGWVGLSEIVAVDDTTFAVIERDNQGGPDARIKKIYTFSVAGLTPQPQGGAFPLLDKTLRADVIPDMLWDNGLVIEKLEGLTIQSDGDVLIATDNDGTDDSSGETQLINLGPLVLGGS